MEMYIHYIIIFNKKCS